jgi:hypothetical protein
MRRAGKANENLALVYCILGRYVDAIALQQRVMEFYHRVLPKNHLDIGEGHVWSDALHALCVL